MAGWWLLVAAFGCNAPAGLDSQEESARLQARVGAPTLEPRIGLSALALRVPGGDGFLYVPESYSSDQPVPLIVGIHGAGGEAGNWAGWYQLAEERGFVLLAIDSRERTWDRIALGYFGPDVDFLDQALGHVFDRVAIDPARVALVGYSDGASWALSLGLHNGDLFRQVVGLAPGFLDIPGPVNGQPDVWIAHGTADPILAVGNTRGRIVPTIRALGLDVTYHEFEGGHQIPAEVALAGVDWLMGG